MLFANIFDDNNLNLFKDVIIDAVGTESAKTNIINKEDNYIIEMELPGYKKEDINISIENNILIVKAKREINEVDDEYICKERICNEVTRKFNHFSDINEENIKAELKDGILTITIEKAKKETKNIEIK